MVVLSCMCCADEEATCSAYSPADVSMVWAWPLLAGKPESRSLVPASKLDPLLQDYCRQLYSSSA